MNSRTGLEICCASLQAVVAAKAGGADRVELCSGLAEGGLTPSIGLIQAAAATGIPVMVLIRPRPGDFVYSPSEADIMCADIGQALRAGASGVVIGALMPSGHPDIPLLSRLVRQARNSGPCSITLHRAADLCVDLEEAIRVAAELKIDRILTSGQAPSALQGLAALKAVKPLATRLGVRIMAGGGINPANAPLLAAVADDIHASARRPLPSAMHFRREGIGMGAPGADEYSRPETDPDLVREIRLALSTSTAKISAP